MFQILNQSGLARLEADAVLTPANFKRIADQLGAQPMGARKNGYVAALKATSRQVVETRWNAKETTNIARPGDWIVTNLSPERKALRDSEGCVNTYVITACRFAELYERRGRRKTPFGGVYRAKGIISAIPLPGGFDIKAPWGERQTSSAGYLLLNGSEVYGNNAATFEATYEVLTD